eukprot:COSAG02_NODE_10428_length_1942_cov_1.838307_1_plen_87_part_00
MRTMIAFTWALFGPTAQRVPTLVLTEDQLPSTVVRDRYGLLYDGCAGTGVFAVVGWERRSFLFHGGRGGASALRPGCQTVGDLQNL